MPNITQNPDYQLVMKFLQNIRPGDMDQESSEQLMMIGQRIQSGGALSDREREMFQAVVGNMPQTEMMDGMVSSGQISQGEAAMGMSGPGMMPSKDGMTYGPSSGVTMEPNVMNMDDAISAGFVKPTRPQARPAAPMQSPRPQARPMR